MKMTKKRVEKAAHEAEEIIQMAFQDTMRKIMTGEFQDPNRWEYGDGDQTPLPQPEESPEAQKLRCLWGKGSHETYA